jgi:polyferredoxin
MKAADGEVVAWAFFTGAFLASMVVLAATEEDWWHYYCYIVAFLSGMFTGNQIQRSRSRKRQNPENSP